MKKQTFFVRLAGGYYYEEKSNEISFTIEQKDFTIKAKQLIFWAPTKNKGETEFLIQISEAQLKKLKSISSVDFDVRGLLGSDSLPPIIRRPPPGAQFLRWGVHY
jgi:hypothetical protein